MEKDIPCRWKPKESRDSYTYIRQNRLKSETVIREKEIHYIMIEESTYQEGITIINIYAPNNGAPKYFIKCSQL